MHIYTQLSATLLKLTLSFLSLKSFSLKNKNFPDTDSDSLFIDSTQNSGVGNSDYMRS